MFWPVAVRHLILDSTDKFILAPVCNVPQNFPLFLHFSKTMAGPIAASIKPVVGRSSNCTPLGSPGPNDEFHERSTGIGPHDG
jgi:hypothetical protein